MSALSDIQLINQIKESHDSQAVIELVNRHTGIYINAIKAYSVYPDFTNRANLADLKDERVTNIYQWALSYDPTRGMKFGSYVGKMAKHMCQNIIYRDKESTPLDDSMIASNEIEAEEQISRDLAIEEIQDEVCHSEDDRFRQIFALRHGENPLSWRKIGAMLHMTHEGARKLYMKHIGSIKEHAIT